MIKKFMGVFVIVVALTAVMTVSASATVTEYSGDGYALYNYAVLPDINTVWTDRATYPYAFIAVQELGEYGFDGVFLYDLWMVSHTYRYVGDGMIYFNVGDGESLLARRSFYISDASLQPLAEDLLGSSVGCDGNWGAFEEWDGINGYYFVIGVWTSRDIFNEDGTVYFSASAPISLDDFTIVQWDGDIDGLPTAADDLGIIDDESVLTNLYRVSGYADPNLAYSVVYAGSTFILGADFSALADGANFNWFTSNSAFNDGSPLNVGTDSYTYFYSSDSNYVSYFIYKSLESPPDEGGVLEPITVFFSSSSLGPEVAGLQFDLNGLTSTVDYTWTVTVKDGSGNTVFTNSETISGETNYSGAQFVYDLEPTKTYTADLVVTTSAGQVGSATTSVQTQNYAYVIDVDSVSVEGKTAIIYGNIVFPADLPSQYQTVYLVSTLDTGFEAENDRVAASSPDFQVYFGDPELAYSTEYTCTLELYYAKSDYTLGVPSGITQEVVFTTGANTPVDPNPEPDDPVVPDPEPEEPTVGDLIDDLEDWNQVTVIPGTVTDKVQQGDDLLDEFEKLEKPEVDVIAPDVDIDVSPVQGFFDILWGSAFFMTMLVTVVGLAFVRYVLFGKV